MKKKILVILPILPQKSYMEPIVQTLMFLNNAGYDVDYIDPLDISGETTTGIFYQECQAWLKKIIMHYDVFMGFSFGGVILQQCFPLLEDTNKPIVLFSTPTFADDELKEKLGNVIRLCKEQQIDEALISLYKCVFYPNSLEDLSFLVNDRDEAAKRLIVGLQLVLETNSVYILQETNVDYLHLIGKNSNLVNIKNVLSVKTGRLVQVPDAGMRMLENNFDFCKQAILERLSV